MKKNNAQQAESIQPSLPELVHAAAHHSAGVIMGFCSERPAGEQIDLEKKPAAYLTWKGYRVTAVSGSYRDDRTTTTAKDIQETSYFVVNPKITGDDGGELENLLVRLARHFGLVSVVSIRNGNLAIIRTQDSAETPAQLIDFDTHRFEAGLYFSVINGHPFPQESVSGICDMTQLQTINGIRARDIMAQQVEQELSRRDH